MTNALKAVFILFTIPAALVIVIALEALFR